MVKRTQEEADRTRVSIVECARNRFSSEGYAATSLVSITDDAGITKGALFHYFSTKEDLFREVWTELQIAMDKEARRAATSSASAEDPFAGFLAGCRVYFEWVQRPDYQRIVLIDGPAVFGMQDWYAQDRILGSENVNKGIAYLAKCGFMTRDQAKPLSVMYQNMLNGAGFALSRNEDGVSPENLFASFERLLRALEKTT